MISRILRSRYLNATKNVYKRSDKKDEQFWEAAEYPKELEQNKKRIRLGENIQPTLKKNGTIILIEEFNDREEGFWFYEQR